jgi:hypothetical protein
MTGTGEALREAAVERLKKKHDFYPHLLAYLLVNAFLVAIWLISGSGYFWPVFPIVGWGIGIAFHAWDTFSRPALSEDRIKREMERLADR